MDPSAVILQNSTEGKENTGKWENHPCWGLGGTSWHGGHFLAWCAPRVEWFGGTGPIFVSHHEQPQLWFGVTVLLLRGLQLLLLLIVPQQSQIRGRGT